MVKCWKRLFRDAVKSASTEIDKSDLTLKLTLFWAKGWIGWPWEIPPLVNFPRILWFPSNWESEYIIICCWRTVLWRQSRGKENTVVHLQCCERLWARHQLGEPSRDLKQLLTNTSTYIFQVLLQQTLLYLSVKNRSSKEHGNWNSTFGCLSFTILWFRMAAASPDRFMGLLYLLGRQHYFYFIDTYFVMLSVYFRASWPSRRELWGCLSVHYITWRISWFWSTTTGCEVNTSLVFINFFRIFRSKSYKFFVIWLRLRLGCFDLITEFS